MQRGARENSARPFQFPIGAKGLLGLESCRLVAAVAIERGLGLPAAAEEQGYGRVHTGRAVRCRAAIVPTDPNRTGGTVQRGVHHFDRAGGIGMHPFAQDIGHIDVGITQNAAPRMDAAAGIETAVTSLPRTISSVIETSLLRGLGARNPWLARQKRQAIAPSAQVFCPARADPGMAFLPRVPFDARFGRLASQLSCGEFLLPQGQTFHSISGAELPFALISA